jgi:Arc/MetJ-type ribon-helix-helix transcriptional regulator
MASITISVPDTVQHFVEQRVADGGFGDGAAYVLSLIEFDQKFQSQEHARIKAAAEAGLKQLDRGEHIEYGSSEQLLEDIVRRGEERLARSRSKSA